MNTKISPLFAVVVALSPLASLGADEPSSPKPLGVPIPQPAFKFEAKTLEGQVKECTEYAKQGTVGPTIELMRANKNEPDKVLSRFEEHIRDKNVDVRLAVLNAASCVKTSKSLAILIALIADQDLGGEAVGIVYYGYLRQQIVSQGGEKLRTALVRDFALNPYPNKAALLIQLFGRSKTPTELLKRRLHSFEPKEHRFESVCINLALCELGDPEGTGNVARYFDEKQVEELLLLMRHLKFVQRKAVLLRAVTLLKDKRNANRAGFAGGPIEYTRLCDEAMVALRPRFDPAHTPSYESVRRFTDEELLSAYKKYMAMLGHTTG